MRMKMRTPSNMYDFNHESFDEEKKIYDFVHQKNESFDEENYEFV